MEIRLREIGLSNGNSANLVEKNISVLGEVLDSLMQAVSTLQSMKEVETNLLFKKLELNFPKEGIDFHKAKKMYEINLIKQALRQTKGNQSKASKLLNVRTSTLNAMIKRHKIKIW